MTFHIITLADAAQKLDIEAPKQLLQFGLCVGDQAAKIKIHFKSPHEDKTIELPQTGIHSLYYKDSSYIYRHPDPYHFMGQTFRAYDECTGEYYESDETYEKRVQKIDESIFNRQQIGLGMLYITHDDFLILKKIYHPPTENLNGFPTGAMFEGSPPITRNEQRKKETQAMYARWRRAYQKLKRKYPEDNDTRIAKKIAKMKLAQGKSPESIRRQMKKI